MPAVGLDDALNELVANDVLVAEADESDPVERAENVLHLLGYEHGDEMEAREAELGE
jgi:TusA-related sulfurtransferase